MQIYYVNLDRREDRRAFIERQLRTCGLEAERIPAITPADLDPEFLHAHSLKGPANALMPVELACSMSHRRAWQRMLERGLPYSLVLEDDVHLSRLLPGFLAEIPPFLGPRGVVRIETRLVPAKTGALAGNVGEIELRRLLSAQWGMAGYIITADCARRILDHPGFFDAAVDHLFFDPTGPLFDEVETLQCFPALCIPGYLLDGGPDRSLWKSDLESERRRRFDRAKGPPLSYGRKIWREGKRLRRILARYAEVASDLVSNNANWRTAQFAGSEDTP